MSSRYCNLRCASVKWSELLWHIAFCLQTPHPHVEVRCTFILTWQFKKMLLKIVLSWRLLLCWTCSLPTFLPVPARMWLLFGRSGHTASLCCLLFYSWKSKCLYIIKRLSSNNTLIKVKRIERRSMWGWVPAPGIPGSHSILSSGHCCAFDGWLYNVLRDSYSPS